MMICQQYNTQYDNFHRNRIFLHYHLKCRCVCKRVLHVYTKKQECVVKDDNQNFILLTKKNCQTKIDKKNLNNFSINFI